MDYMCEKPKKSKILVGCGQYLCNFEAISNTNSALVTSDLATAMCQTSQNDPLFCA